MSSVKSHLKNYLWCLCLNIIATKHQHGACGHDHFAHNTVLPEDVTVTMAVFKNI